MEKSILPSYRVSCGQVAELATQEEPVLLCECRCRKKRDSQFAVVLLPKFGARRNGMVGVICRRNILAHPLITIRCFGWRLFFRALIAGHSQTFLSLLADAKGLHPPTVKVPELVERCVKLELQAKRIYERLAARLLGHRLISNFFETLACQEETHAELLGLCREVAGRSVWKEECFAPCRDAIPHLERQMENIESSLESIDGVTDALRLVIQIEGSEVNQTFESVVAASASVFVRKLLAFQNVAARVQWIGSQLDAVC